jgi:hypothetical protein
VDLRDFIVTPLLIMLIYAVAWIIKPYVTDLVTKKYFFPALTARIVGAVIVGLVYQFYYDGGDTFTYHTHGSRVVWEAFSDSFLSGSKLIFTPADFDPALYKYTSHIYFYRDPPSFFIVRLSAFFDLLTFSSYAGTAILFAVVGFTGSWMFFLTFYKQYPHLQKPLAWAALFIPSVIFWGSGLLKDTVTLSCLGIATFYIHRIFIEGKVKIKSMIFLVISIAVIFTVKKFILQAFLPAAITWVFAFRFYSIRSVMLRVLVVPVVIVVVGLLGWYSVIKVGEGDDRYAIDKIAKTSRITAYDIRFWSGRKAGSGYSLGDANNSNFDASVGGLIRLAPEAINVALFRPYLWEVSNPLMLLSALESLGLFLISVVLLFKKRLDIFRSLSEGNILFCLTFSIIFAFAVGVSTFNFGTLSRYKIAMMPFFATGLVLLYYSNSAKKERLQESTE